jgi:hypothetical protein
VTLARAAEAFLLAWGAVFAFLLLVGRRAER